MVGALILSRSVAQVAAAFSNEILENVERDVTASLDRLSTRASDKRKTGY
jgi:TetR/AcrR family transcriptional repressor of nem operon